MKERNGQEREAETLNDIDESGKLAGLRRTVEEQQWHLRELRGTLSIAREKMDGQRIVDGILALSRADEDSNRAFDEELAFVPWWPVPAFPERSIRPAPGYACASLGDRDLRVIAISVFGREDIDLDSIVSLVADRQFQSRDFLPVFLTNASSFGMIQEHGFAFAYFPKRGYPHPDDALASPRYDFISRKWGIESFLDLGKERAEQSDAEEILKNMPTMNETTLIAVPNKTPISSGAAIDDRPTALRLRGEAVAAAAFERVQEDERMIRESGIFDEEWYRAKNPDVDRRGIDAVRHFLNEGALRGRDPSPLFRTAFYARQMLAYPEKRGS